MHILRQTDLVDVTWKNGGGVTRNIAKGLRRDQIAWTISRADVTRDGPFSDFAGMVRVLTVVSGGAMTLKAPSLTLETALWEPVRFGGELSITSQLDDGPLTDLNLMFDPCCCADEVAVRRGALEQTIQCPAKGLIAFHVLAGTPRINAEPLEVADTALSEGSDITLSMAQNDAVLEIRLSYLDQSEAIRLCIANR